MPSGENPELCLGSDIDPGDLSKFIEFSQNELSLKRGGLQLLGLFDESKVIRDSQTESDDVFFRGILWDGSLGGFIWAVSYFNYFNQKFCSINALVVRKDLRGRGLGTELYKSCEEWSINKGSIGIEIQVLPGDRDTKNFCESKGLVARSLIMYKPLDS